MHRRALALILVACGTPTTPPARPAPVAEVTIDAREPDAFVPDAPPAMTLTATPTHEQLQWVLDAVGKRHGDIDHDELVQHIEGKLLTNEFFRKWAATADGAQIERIEVDDPTYIRAYFVAHGLRWRVVIEIKPPSNKIQFMQNDLVK